MPAMSSSTVHAARTVTLWSLRAVAVWLTAWGLFQVGARLTYAVLDALTSPGASILDRLTVRMDIGATHGLFRGVPTLAVGLALALLSSRLAHWIVRPPRLGCVNCGHPLGEPGATPRCSECGYPSA